MGKAVLIPLQINIVLQIQASEDEWNVTELKERQHFKNIHYRHPYLPWRMLGCPRLSGGESNFTRTRTKV